MRQIAAIALATVTAASPAASPAHDWTWPVRGEVITPYRNGTDPYARGQHRGIDIAADEGTPVMAAAAGTVRYAGRVGSAGLTVSVRTADGRFDNSYLHLSSITVRRGDPVERGQRIGAVGTTGRRSAERPHLHFGVREAGKRHAYRDPLDFLPPPPPPTPEPRPTPVPAPAPERARPRPAPAPIQRPAPAPVPAPLAAPHPAPVPLRAPDPAPRPRHVPAPAPRPKPAPRYLPEPVAAPRIAREEAHHARAHRRTAEAARSVPILGPATATPDAAAPARHGGGIDLGWLAVCIGCLAAALALGRPLRGRGADGRRLGLLAGVRLLAGRG